jgi:hypothetical protein
MKNRLSAFPFKTLAAIETSKKNPTHQKKEVFLSFLGFVNGKK